MMIAPSELDHEAGISQEHYLKAYLEKFGLADCNRVDKQISS